LVTVGQQGFEAGEDGIGRFGRGGFRGSHR
jgi:hypothetical protein